MRCLRDSVGSSALVPALAGAMLTLGLLTRPAPAQDPAQWPALSIEAFVAEVRSALARPDVPAATRQQAATQSAARLARLAPDAVVAYDDFLWLYFWAGDQLTAARKNALAPRRAPPGPEVAGNWSIDVLRRVAAAQTGTDVPLSERDAVLGAYLANKTTAAAYGNLDAADTAWLVRRVRDLQNRDESGSVLADASVSALRDYASQLLARTGTVQQMAYADLVTLFQWAHNQMSAQSAAAAQARINAPQNAAGEIESWTIGQLQASDNAMKNSGVEQTTRDALLAQWLAANNQKLENVAAHQQLAWIARRVRHAGAYAAAFSATWTGQIKAPVSGNYTFFISPINVNLDYRGERIEESIRVTIGNQVVLSADKDDWQFQSAPVALQANVAKPLRFELHYADSSTGNPRLRGSAAVLWWQPPGQAKQLVPSSALVPPGGSGVGLQAEYRLQAPGDEQVVTRAELALDHALLRSDPIVGTHLDLLPGLEDQLLARLSEEGFLALAESALAGDNRFTPSEQRRALRTLRLAEEVFCGRPAQSRYGALLLARPALLRSPSVPAALYRRARFLAPEQALQLLGTWAQLQADQVPRITLDFYDANRRALRWTAQMLTWQQRGAYQTLDEQFLALPDGSCALPVAYVLAYAHFSQGTIHQWIDRLDAVLENPALAGDARVNWLIARAHAQEIRRGRGGRHYLTLERLLGGIAFLDEAALVAQSPSVQLRVYGEMIARFGAQERVDVANQLVQKAGSQISGTQAGKQIASWQAELQSLDAQIAQRRAAHEALAQKAYLDRLRARYQKAVAAKNESTAARYRNLLNQAGAPVD